MPEYTEVKACAYTIQRWLDPLLTQGQVLRVKGLWIDATKAERSQAEPGSPEASGMVFKIDSTCEKKRGSSSRQQYIWPRRNDGTVLSDADLCDLILEGVTSTPRTVVLKFNKMCLQVGAIWLDSLYIVTNLMLASSDPSSYTHRRPTIHLRAVSWRDTAGILRRT